MTAGGQPRWTKGSAEEIVLRHPERVWGCLDQIPKPSDPRRFLPCDQPHAYEATGHLLFLPGLKSAPTPRQLRDVAAECEVAHRNPAYKGLDLQVLWKPVAEMLQPIGVVGSCWASRPDGKDMPPLR
jgi:hypothetical protein